MLNEPITSEPDTLVTESWTAFAAWGADALGLKLAFDGEAYRIEVDHFGQPEEGSATGSTVGSSLRRSWIRRQPKPEPAEETPPFVTDAPKKLLAELFDRLRAHPEPLYARPTQQPTAVHELTDRLFAAYTLEGGKAHVAGCHLEDMPLVRLSQLGTNGDGNEMVSHTFYDEEGTPLSAELVTALGLAQVQCGSDPTPRIEAGRLTAAISAARHQGGQESAIASIVLAKRAWGRLRFEFGDDSVDTPFDGWARTLTAPPIVCPQTGRETFHLAMTERGERGTIAAAEEIAACSVTGHRRVLRHLVRCAVTDKLAEPEWIAPCGVTGENVLKSELVPCKRCGQLVAKRTVTASGCHGCDSAKHVSPKDPRLAKVLAKHVRLASHRWALAEMPAAFVLETTSWLRKRVVTIDKVSLDILREAEASRFSSTWQPLP